MQFSENVLVSIVIPCYNHEQFVNEAIWSVINQDFKNIELIIIDDGSSDGSVEKIEEMRLECELRFARFEFRHRGNIGLCATLNEAIEWIRGCYVVFFASDDVMISSRVSDQVAYIQNKNDVAAVFSGVIYIDEYGNKIGEKTVNVKKYDFEDVLYFKGKLYAPTMLIKSSALKLASPLPVSICIEDRYIQLCITSAGWKIATDNTLNTKYRIHRNNSSKRILQCYTDNIRLIYKFHHKNKINKALALNDIGCAISLRKSDRFLSVQKLANAFFTYPPCVLSLRFFKALFLIIID